ncbi:MAG: 5-methylcytosine-specific restriction enzyme subunit McrC [Euryarchaeota archaeon ADurb.Bin294]|jgi:5-methylcytosine-specific restriction enzyme subunit McrC|nr:hypothetical protein [Methanospirillum sp.]OQA58858.1 MAG: 5-methylcytosine-specific restriction enzyme subunit McrC [Euryarchaeota archaeon ADurb.Bin294]
MKYNPISLFEWVEYSVQEGENVGVVGTILTLPPGVFKLFDEIDPKEIICKRKNNTLKPNSLAGVVRIGGISFQFLPKLFKNNYEEHKSIITKNLILMLSYCDIPFKVSDLSLLDHEELDMLDFYIDIFANKLNTLLVRNQHRQYQKKTDYLKFSKGKLNIHSSVNPTKLHIIPCIFSEFSYDTPLNRLFKYCVMLMMRQVKRVKTKEHLRQILLILEPVSYKPFTYNESKKLVLDRLSRAFEPFLKFCQIYLSHSALSLQASHIEFFSLLVPMEKVFEQFIAGVLDKYRKEFFSEKVSVKPQYNKGNLISDPEKVDGEGLFQLRPDIFINHPQTPVIIDTKYKLLNETDNKAGVIESDAYQMCAYGAKGKVTALMLLYPDTGDKIFRNWEIPYEYTKKGLLVRTITLSHDLSSIDGWNKFLMELFSYARDLLKYGKKYQINDPLEMH